jgi:hypothetical protein
MNITLRVLFEERDYQEDRNGYHFYLWLIEPLVLLSSLAGLRLLQLALGSCCSPGTARRHVTWQRVWPTP